MGLIPLKTDIFRLCLRTTKTVGLSPPHVAFVRQYLSDHFPVGDKLRIDFLLLPHFRYHRRRLFYHLFFAASPHNH